MKKICLVACLLLMLPVLLLAQDTIVTFSQPGGFYENSFSLALTCDEAYHIRYTTNGGSPTANSTLYEAPLFLDQNLYSNSNFYSIQTTLDELFYAPTSVQRCITIRACAFDEGENPVGHVKTQSYFINALGCDTHGLPVISIAADSTDLFDYYTGIFVPGVNFDPENSYWTGNYYMSGDAWERVVNIEFYERNDNSGVNQLAGLRTHGGTARRGLQKGMKLYAREEYGTKRFYHRFFNDVPKNSVKHLVLKPFTCQWFSTGIQDWICNSMAKDIGLEYISSRPTVLFINGEYWGIYYVCERPDSHYLEDHFGHNDNDYNVIGNWYGEVEDGDNNAFVEMMQWLEDADLSVAENYNHLCSLIDVDNLINYYCLELFIANNDWPANNMRCYQYNDGRWRWIFFDGDDCLMKMDFDVFGNATSEENLGWPTDRQSTLMFRRLLENEDFRIDFFNRFDVLLAGAFDYATTNQFFNNAASLVRNEIPLQSARFHKPSSMTSWENGIASINRFLSNRVENMRERINEFAAVEEYLAVGVSMYPNPTHEVINLAFNSFENNLSDSKIELYDSMGRLVFTRDYSESFTVDLPSGLYILKIGNFTQRIVVQR